jgi:hypothetical protein
MTAQDAAMSCRKARDGRRMKLDQWVLPQRTGASKPIEDGPDLCQICLTGEQQLQGDPGLAGVKRIGGDEPALNEIDLTAFVAI